MQVVEPYAKPTPPAGVHRYVISLFLQPAAIDVRVCSNDTFMLLPGCAMLPYICCTHEAALHNVNFSNVASGANPSAAGTLQYKAVCSTVQSG